MAAVLNYTTNVPVERTLGEVQAILGKAGADRVSVTYSGGQPVGLGFTLHTPAGARTFALPVDIGGVHVALRQAYGAGELLKRVPGVTTERHAARVAWRIAKDWLEAQVALIQARMATLDQIMLPFLEVDQPGGRTLYDVFAAKELAAAGQVAELE